MKHAKTIGAAILVSGLAISGQVFAGGASAEALSYTCAGCHGTNGASVGPASPSLGGMSATYISDSMKAFKSGERESTIMMRIAKGYDDDDFAKMGKFFAAQPRHVAMQSGGSMSSKGAKLYDKYCEKCHADNGTDPEDDAGLLAGQWTPYLAYSLEDAMDGSRDYGKKMMKQLKKMHKKEGDAGTQALLDFFASQK
jgi:sulfide dehydrogenase cytochrome subunit